MTTTVTMLQTRLGESGSLWTVGNSYAASDAFAAMLITSNLATGTLPKSRSLVPLWGQTDSTGAVASVVDGDGNAFIRPFAPTFKPWKIATFGDSRANTNSTTPPVEAHNGIQAIRTPMWIAGHMMDAEITRNYGVSGDSATGWNSGSRSGGKTYLDLATSDVDAVWIQYGINDCIAGAAAATISDALKALCVEIMKQGRYVLFEAINPVGSAAANYVVAQSRADAVNATMQEWLNYFPNQAVFVNTAPSLKVSSGYANPAYYNADTLHFIIPGAYLSGQMVAAAARTLLPRRPGAFPGPDLLASNLLNLVAPSVYIAAEAGTATTSTSFGIDADGPYCEFNMTPTALSGGLCRVRCETNVNFQTSAPPYVALLGNEILQGSARFVMDDGGNGAPAAYSVAARQRFYTASLFKDMGAIPAASIDPNFTEKLDVRLTTPKLYAGTASVVANPSQGGGYSLQAYVELAQTGSLVRLRMYNPQLRRVGYSQAVLTAAAFAIPASTVAYTNASQGNQQITVGGGTVTVIAVNGVTTGLTSGSFVLNPADTITLTYSAAPTWGVKQV